MLAKEPRLSGCSLFADGHGFPVRSLALHLAMFVSCEYLPWSRDLLLGVGDQFIPLRQPARGARDGEQYSEHLRLKTHRLVDDARVKIDIRVKLPRDEVIIFQRDAFQLQRNFDLGIASCHLEYLIGNLLDDPGAGVVVLVHAMTEAHQLDLALFD